ncbi:MAG: pimeloyl-ACP methyl ester esterase BioH [Burkholderiales bacterium]|nr:pimeloyl-ACP methyl ester esterase BioH [Burkholderiales bacterium]
MSATLERAGLHVESVGAGPPLVLLHGWAMHSGLFGPLLPGLADRFRVHAVDLPGHGRSQAAAPDTLDGYVDAVARSIGAREALTVLGWSFGGQVALRWASREGDRVTRLVLVCTSPRFVAAPDWPHAMAAATLARFGDDLVSDWRQTLLRFLTLQVQGSDEGRRALAHLRRQLFARGDPKRSSIAAALRVLAATDLRAEVRSVTAPALAIAGERDTLAPAAAGAWLARAMPDARFARIDGAAHAPFLSHRAAFDRALAGFLHDAG